MNYCEHVNTMFRYIDEILMVKGSCLMDYYCAAREDGEDGWEAGMTECIRLLTGDWTVRKMEKACGMITFEDLVSEDAETMDMRFVCLL